MNLWLEKEVGPTEVLVLVSNESVLSNRLDLTIVLDTYIQNIITKKSMITKTYNFLWYNYCDIISIAIENGYQLTKVSVLIDRLPSLIESCSSTNSSSTTNITSSTTSSTFSSTSFSSNDIDSLYNLLLVLMNQNSLTITESITKVLTKFTTCATKLIQRENYYNGLQLLKILVSSNYRSLLILSANHVRQVCYTVINSVNCNNYGYSNSNCNSSNKSNSTSNKNNNSSSNNRNSVSTVSIDIIQLLTDVITMYTSIDNTEIWIDLWKTIVNDCNLLLSKLGLNVRETESQTNKTILPNLDVFNSVGFERANGIRKVFSILCTLLQKVPEVISFCTN